MIEFYKNLKKLREEKGISLEDINKRTKINITILRSLENGEFAEISETYLRLFIRAYAAEIGADPDKTIFDLDDFLSIKDKGDQKREYLRNKVEEKVEEKVELNPNKRSAKDMRSDIIKGSVLIVILIFAIYIIRLINEEEINQHDNDSAEYVQSSPLNSFIDKSYINENLWKESLLNDFDILSESYQAIGSSPPLTFKITTAERVWYRYMIDSLKSLESVIPRGDNHQYKFNKSFKVIFNHSNTLSLYLNDNEIRNLKASPNPVIIDISYPNKQVKLQHFVSKL